VPEPVAVALGRSLLAASHPPRLHHHVMLEALAIDHDDPEPGIVDVHNATIGLPRSDRTGARRAMRRSERQHVTVTKRSL
jgi:hypothetical protein